MVAVERGSAFLRRNGDDGKVTDKGMAWHGRRRQRQLRCWDLHGALVCFPLSEGGVGSMGMFLHASSMEDCLHSDGGVKGPPTPR
jgi:hypothetical protein